MFEKSVAIVLNVSLFIYFYLEEFGEDKPVKKGDGPVVSGAVATEGAAFPTEAVKSYHDKPHPTHDKGAANQKPKIIQQPKK